MTVPKTPRKKATRPPLDLLIEIQKLRDEIRVKLHLAGMDARKEWEELEPIFVRVEGELRERGARITGATRERAEELRHELRAFLDRRSGLCIEDVMMREVVGCSPDDTLSRAAQIMWDHDCGAVPVLEADGTVAAIITDRDLCMAAYTRGIRLSEATVASAMSTTVQTCAPDDSVVEAARIMRDYHIRRLPVVTRDRKLVGIVSAASLARAFTIAAE